MGNHTLVANDPILSNYLGNYFVAKEIFPQAPFVTRNSITVIILDATKDEITDQSKHVTAAIHANIRITVVCERRWRI